MEVKKSVHFTSDSNEWATPQDFFDRLNEEFSFTVDVAATPENAKCERFYTWHENGLAQSWKGERVWCNPPYGRDLARWIEKAATSNADIVVMLIPARTDTRAWHDHIFGNAEIRFVKGRLKFGGGKQTHRSRPQSLSGVKDAPFASAVVIYRFCKN